MTRITSSSSLLGHLRAVLIRQRLVLFSAGLLATGSAALAVWILLSLVANVMVLPVWFKVVLLLGAVGASAYFFVSYALRRLFGGNIDQVALALEEKHPDLKGRLIAAVQFARTEHRPGYSEELIAFTERQAIEQAGLLNLNEVVSFHPVLKTGRLMAVAALAGLALLVLFPGFFSYSYEVFSNPTTEIAPPLGYKVVATPGSTEWIKYKDITIGASIFGQRLPENATLYFRFAGGSWQQSPFDLRTIRRQAVSTGDSLGIGLTIRQINKSFDYYVEAGRVKTDVQRVDVVDRPRVNNISLSLFYPSYTGLSPQTISENNGSFSAVVGTRVNLKVETNLPVERVELTFSDSSRQLLAVAGKNADGSLVVDKSRSYHVRLLDRLQETNPDPIEYYVTAIPDEYPTVDVLRPGFDANLTDEMILPLKVHIADDYGFSSLVMKFTVSSQGRTSEEHVAVLHYSERIKTEGDVELNWDMDQLALFPGDYVTYYFEVADNDRISGPKVTKSRSFIARLPSLEELIAESDRDNSERVNQTEQLLQTGKELVERLKAAVRKLDSQSRDAKKNDWQQQKELESIAGKNAEMMENIQRMAQKMDSSLEKLQENSLMSREIMEKMAQIQKLFEEVATPEMKEAQRKLMDALKNMDPQKLQQAMKDFQMSQQELMERLERTLALLKRMQVEQKMEAMVRQAEQILQRQEQTNSSTDSARNEQLPSLAPKEDAVTQAMQELKNSSEELQKLINEAKLEQNEAAQKFAEAVRKNQADQNMQKMSDALSQKQKSGAQQEGKEAAARVREMLGEMQNQQMAFKGGDQEKLKQAMRRAIDDANYLSKSQEELLKEAAAMSPQSSMMRDLAQQQQDLSASCSGLRNSISELGKQSPFVAAELGSIVDQATQSMAQAMQEFDQQRGPNAVREQRDAMSQLNRASIRLMESLEQQNQCNKGGNCNKNISQMEGMCDKQNMLNQETQKQCNNPQPGRESLQRLAGEQGAIRKSLEDLAQEFGNSRQVLGRLDDIAKEMKKVEEDLATGSAGEETTARQLNIYSRMLEASRSLQRKDFTEQRKATTAAEQPVYIPPNLPSDLLNDRAHFEDRLRQFLGNDYPSQYEEQIKAYFRALLQIESTPSNEPQPMVPAK
ncbi:MAG: DUF4175 family protein [Candidatus Zixiibacteriota bacterium]